ncbi:MAG: 4Fe-4S binding protein [Thermoanaerobaculia bacterium]
MRRLSLPRYRINTLVRLFFLFLTPVLLPWIDFAFVWHSIYFRSVTIVLLLWAGAVALSPLVGRVVCGWLCPFGTIQDLVAPVTVFQPKRERPFEWLRWAMLALFVATAFGVGAAVRHASLFGGWRWAPARLSPEFTAHYKQVWMYDAVGVGVVALFLGRRGLCRYACAMGKACAVGARTSLLAPVVSPSRCTGCRRCDEVCPARVRVSEFRETAVVRDSECILCGYCADVCSNGAIRFRFAPSRAHADVRPPSS